MVWVIMLVWIVVAISLVVFVLRLAHGESYDRGSSDSSTSEARAPRRVGSFQAFTPSQSRQLLRRAHPYVGNEDTMDHPVYVNGSSVVEMRALAFPELTESDEVQTVSQSTETKQFQ